MTGSDNHVGWISSASGRSTSDILWSCFSILLVCTYKCIHFNVASREESEAEWFKWHGLYLPETLLWRKWAKRAAWMLLIVLAPEIGVAVAMDQYLLARECRHFLLEEEISRVKESKMVEDGTKDVEMATMEVKVDEGKWKNVTNTHAFFANMGGFTLKIFAPYPPERGQTQSDHISPDDISAVSLPGLSHGQRHHFSPDDISAVSLPELDHTQRNHNSLDGISQVEVPVPVDDDPSTMLPDVSFPVENWDDLGQYTNKLQSSY
jgi:hypothetical protein